VAARKEKDDGGSTRLRMLWADWIHGYPVGSERLAKGLEVARKAHVVSPLRIEGSLVAAEVQGTQALPYRVVLDFVPVPEDAWARALELLQASPQVFAALRRGDFDSRVESLFAEAGVSIFPERYKQVKASCTCPDWLRPCKHSIAVFHHLGRLIDTDPMLLLELRGMHLGMDAPRAEQEVEELIAAPELALDPETFYGGNADYTFLERALTAELKPKRLLHRLGPLELFGTRMDLERFLDATYDQAAVQAAIRLGSAEPSVEPSAEPSVEPSGSGEVQQASAEEDGAEAT
jgi:uncharacterized Zn finger protein